MFCTGGPSAFTLASWASVSCGTQAQIYKHTLSPISMQPSTSHLNPRKPAVHGHRGCRGLRPENTIPAFLHALELGVDVLELDVVVSADDQVVVSHEPWMNPLNTTAPHGIYIGPQQGANVNFYQRPYSEIRRYDCGLRSDPNFPEQVSMPAFKPLLREVFTAVEAHAHRLGIGPVGYSVEVKSSAAGDDVYHPAPGAFVRLVLAELHQADVMARTTLLSFDARVLREVHDSQPALATCLLLENDQPWFSNIRQLGFVPTVLGPDFTTVTADAVLTLRRTFPGLSLVPWTVNEVQDMMLLRALGVDGITTDFPDRLIRVLQS